MVKRFERRPQAGNPRNRGAVPCRGKNVISSKAAIPHLCPTQPPIQLTLGAVFSGMKEPGSAPDRSHSPSAEITNEWRHKPNPHMLSRYGQRQL